MQILKQTLRRPAICLALALALIALLATSGCGSAAEPEPVAAPTASTESHTMTGDSGGHQTEQHSSDAAKSHDANDSDSSNQTETGAATADAVIIDMTIAGRASNLSRDDLQVKKDDTVNINFTADEEGEIHLHGYDLTAPVSPGTPGTLTFVADTAGAFGINFHVFGGDSIERGDSGDSHSHAPDTNQVISDDPVSVNIIAEADTHGGIDVRIEPEGFRFAPDLVDQEHTPGAGHAHIYLDGEKLGRVFESEYHIDAAPPGEHEIRVSLNTNDHSDLVFDGRKVEASATVNVPDVGQGHGDGDRETGHEGDGHDHDAHDHGEREVVAEVHLGNLEVYP